jgi:hypothetical protein
MKTSVERDAVYTLIRCCEWGLWLAMATSLYMLLGSDAGARRRIDWIGYITFMVGAMLLSEAGRRRKKGQNNPDKESNDER